jgi:hypothetical protein
MPALSRSWQARARAEGAIRLRITDVVTTVLSCRAPGEPIADAIHFMPDAHTEPLIVLRTMGRMVRDHFGEWDDLLGRGGRSLLLFQLSSSRLFTGRARAPGMPPGFVRHGVNAATTAEPQP